MSAMDRAARAIESPTKDEMDDSLGESLFEYSRSVTNLSQAMVLAAEIERLGRVKRELSNALANEAQYEGKPVREVAKAHPLTALVDERIAELRGELVLLV